MKKTDQNAGSIHSLKLQFTFFFIFFVLILYAVVVSTTIQQLNGISETISTRLGVPIVSEAAALIDGDAFERLTKTLDPMDPYYEQIRLRMLAIKEKSQCLYLYTMAPSPEDENIYRYIIDGSAGPEDRDAFSPLGTEEDISGYRTYVVKTMESQTPQISHIDYNSPWGWVVTAYAPIVNSSGLSVGFVGCDFKAEEVYEQLWTRIIRQLVISAIIIMLSLPAYFYMVNRVDKQNQHLLALKEQAEKISQALENERDIITAMKDALKVGVFLMDKNFIIQDHYSRYLETVLDLKDLAGKKFTDLLAASISQKEIADLMKYFVLLFNRSLVSNRSFTTTLMENINPIQELSYTSPKTGGKKELQWTFAPVDWGNNQLFVLGNIQDITHEKVLQRRLLEEEQKRREEKNSLFALFRSSPNIIQELEKIRQEKKAPGDIIDKILALKPET
jgi:hypothetical protein